MADSTTQTGYAPVNGLQMYYEIHGAGDGTPLVLIHGSFMSIATNWGQWLPALSGDRQVIAVELQGHGRTADIDRALSYEQLADDIAALLAFLEIDRADMLGYSMGGHVALAVAIGHPERVRKLVVVSAGFNVDASYPEVAAGIAAITPELFAGSPIEAEYARLAPEPGNWPRLIEKVKALSGAWQGWSPEDVAGIESPTLIVLGDADGVRPEHAVEFFRLRGGGVFGDYGGVPDAQLAVLPGTTHVGVMMRPDLLQAIVPPFLDAPSAGAPQAQAEGNESSRR